ncbi:MFS transporter [Streptomyces sp. DT203]|uniref:MFS transporter n=1 Tax=Streptomyces sp. DT203 TaxID=3393424 RepID=UPI003CF3641B
MAISYVDRVNISVLITDNAFLDRFGLAGDRVAQGALMTIFLLGYGPAAFVLTPVYETLLGVRRGLLVSVATWAVLTFVSPWIGSLFLLLAVRCLLGAAEGPLFSLKTMYASRTGSPTPNWAARTRSARWASPSALPWGCR